MASIAGGLVADSLGKAIADEPMRQAELDAKRAQIAQTQAGTAQMKQATAFEAQSNPLKLQEIVAKIRAMPISDEMKQKLIESQITRNNASASPKPPQMHFDRDGNGYVMGADGTPRQVVQGQPKPPKGPTDTEKQKAAQQENYQKFLAEEMAKPGATLDRAGLNARIRAGMSLPTGVLPKDESQYQKDRLALDAKKLAETQRVDNARVAKLGSDIATSAKKAAANPQVAQQFKALGGEQKSLQIALVDTDKILNPMSSATPEEREAAKGKREQLTQRLNVLEMVYHAMATPTGGGAHPAAPVNNDPMGIR